MVWDQSTGLIVMLVKDQERGQERTAIYWPVKGTPLRTADLTITLVR